MKKIFWAFCGFIILLVASVLLMNHIPTHNTGRVSASQPARVHFMAATDGMVRTNGVFEKNRDQAIKNVLAGSRSINVYPDRDNVISCQGITLTVPKGAVKSPMAITVERMAKVDRLNPGLCNTTGGAYGYRFLPDGTKFLKPIKITIPYDKATVKTNQDFQEVYTFFYNEKQKYWERLERLSVDQEAGTVTSLTTHFTDMINGILSLPDSPKPLSFNPNSIKDMKAADPGTGINLIEAPKANNQGNASLTYPIEVPAGRNGMQAQVAVQYNSDGDNGWMGLGWDLPVQSVSIDTRWGVPRYDNKLETETYVLNGMELTPTAYRGELKPRTQEKRFHARVEGSFQKIVRHGDSPCNYWWEVTDKKGTRYFYGGTPETGLIANTVLSQDEGTPIFRWTLVQVRDTNNNIIDYTYKKVTDCGLNDGTQGVPGVQLYPDTICYTGQIGKPGPYKVIFYRDRDLQEQRRTDVAIDGRAGFKVVTADLLRKVEVKFNDQLIRSYEFTYQPGAFKKTLLSAIVQYSGDGNEFNRHTFSYYDNVTEGDGYRGFSGEKRWNNNIDNLSKNESETDDIHLYVGVGPAAGRGKSNSVGVKVGSNKTKTDDTFSLIDLNGDGISDKVYEQGGSYYLCPGYFDAGGALIFSSPREMPSLRGLGIGHEESSSDTYGLEAYVGTDGFGIRGSGHYSTTKTASDTYFTDTNGDGLVDIVHHGKVYFNRLKDGVPEFIADSSGTPAPIAAGGDADITEAIKDLNDINQEMQAQAPLMDAVRCWKAPYSGKIRINAPIHLVQTERNGYNADGVRVAIQLKASEQWALTIKPDDFTTYTPEIGELTVHKGDQLYFRVQSVNDPRFDQVAWDPEIVYVNVSGSNVDANGMNPYRFKASEDFVTYGRSGELIAPAAGTVHLKGQLDKGLTSDDLRAVVYQNGNKLYEETIKGDQSGTFSIERDLNVQAEDQLIFRLEIDSPVDLGKVRWLTSASYTSINDSSIPITDENGEPTIKMACPGDVTVYSESDKDGAETGWTATKDGTLTIDPYVALGSGVTGEYVLTIKRGGELVAKQVVSVGAVQTGGGRLEIETTQGDILYFEFSSKDPEFAQNVMSENVRVFYAEDTPSSGEPTYISVPSRFYFTSLQDLLPANYRGWSVFAYNGNGVRAQQAIVESELKGTKDYNVDDPQVFILNPNNSGARWTGEDDNCYIDAQNISSSRRGGLSLDLPELRGGAGMRAVSRVSVAKQTAVQGGVDVGGLNGAVSHAKGSSYAELDYIDMNGDRYPDIISPGKVQYTEANGGLESNGRPVLNGKFRENDNVDNNLGIGCNVPLMKQNASGYTQGSAKGGNQGSMASLGISAGILDQGKSEGKRELMDMNGDGLPDLVYQNGSKITVSLNLGYDFGMPEVWGDGEISFGKNNTENLGANLGFNIISYSFAGGISKSRNDSSISSCLTDINGDGLVDWVRTKDGGLEVALNTGGGFAPFVLWNGALPQKGITESSSTSKGAGVYFTYSFTYWFIRFVINPGYDHSDAKGYRVTGLMDIDGDGFPDQVSTEDDGAMRVALSQVGTTNKLKTVNRPLGASFTLSYERAGNTYDMPQCKWVLSRAEMNDGHSGDGIDTQLTTYRYENGRYDRLEREFLGFEKVITEQRDIANGERLLRSVAQTYRTDSTYTRGLLVEEAVQDGDGRTFTKNVNTYRLYDIETKTDLVDEYPVNTVATVFPQLVKAERYFYEGQAEPGVYTYVTYDYDLYGNVKTYFDAGDAGAGDDVEATIAYHYDDDQDRYIVEKPTSIQVSSNGRLMRRREGDYDDRGNMLQLRQYLGDGQASVTDFAYNEYGNLISVTGPPNGKGQRYEVRFVYDDQVQTYITRLTDSFGYTSTAAYDYRFGVETEATDINNQGMRKTYDEFGRLTQVFSPYDENIPAVAFAYYPNEATPRAVTKNKILFDAYNAETIDTVLFIDGLKRVVQTKKEGEVQETGASTSSYGMNVSGAVVFDALGRVIKQGQPVFESGYDDIALYPVAMKNPTATNYDILDRTTDVWLPDNSWMWTKYGIKDGRFETTVVDPNGRAKYAYQDVQGNTVETVQFNNCNNPNYVDTTIHTKYEYSPLNEIMKVIDNKGNTTTMVYDMLGRRTSIDNPDRGLVEYQYDLAGNLEKKIDGNLKKKGQAIQYIYNYNRLEKIDYPVSHDVEYIYGGPGADYNRAGRLEKVTDVTGVTELFYGKLGEEIQNIRSIHYLNTGLGTWTYKSQYNYDYLGRIQSMTFPDGETLTYTYDKGGQVTGASGVKFSDNYTYIKDIHYDEFGQRVYIKYGNDTESRYTYDPKRRWLNRIGTQNAYGTKFQDTTYVFDKIGNVCSYNNAAMNVRQVYSYDNLYQLTGARGSSPVQNNSATSTYEQTFTYDDLGNITTKKSNVKINGNPVQDPTYKFTYHYEGAKPHAPNQIGNWDIQYDDNGNIIQRARRLGQNAVRDEDNVNLGPVDDYTWDEENRMIQCRVRGEITAYTYDYNGDRTNKNNPHGETIYVSGFFQIQHNLTGTKHIYVGDNRLAVKLMRYRQPNNYNECRFEDQVIHDNDYEKKGFYVLHSDHLGSSNVVTDYQGNQFQHLEYMPYGESWVEEGQWNDFLRIKYNGKEQDPETNMYYYGARYLDPMFSRWVSPDPAFEGYLPEIPIDSDSVERNKKLPGLGGVFNYINLNVYQFGGNNPLKYKDPDGAVIDTIADVGFIGWDVYDLIAEDDETGTRGYQDWGNWAALGTDVALTAVPFLTGGGKAIKTARFLHFVELGRRFEAGVLASKGLLKNTLKFVTKHGNVIPDIFDKSKKLMGEIKHVKKLDCGKQMRGIFEAFEKEWTKDKGFTFTLIIREDTKLGGKLLEKINELRSKGMVIVIERLPKIN